MSEGAGGGKTATTNTPPPTKHAPVLLRVQRQAAHRAGVLVGEVAPREALLRVVLRGPQGVRREARAPFTGWFCWGVLALGGVCWFGLGFGGFGGVGWGVRPVSFRCVGRVSHVGFGGFVSFGLGQPHVHTYGSAAINPSQTIPLRDHRHLPHDGGLGAGHHRDGVPRHELVRRRL